MIKTCSNTDCDNTFPAFRITDGKKQNFCNRKYCFECSPIGGNNRVRLENPVRVWVNRPVRTGDDCVCINCGKEYVFKQHTGMTTQLCIACVTRNRRRGIKQRAVDYKGGSCSRCGYNKCIASLDFHHVDAAEKDFSISHKWGKWEIIQRELDKCILLCRNCHGEIHYK